MKDRGQKRRILLSVQTEVLLRKRQNPEPFLLNSVPRRNPSEFLKPQRLWEASAASAGQTDPEKVVQSLLKIVLLYSSLEESQAVEKGVLVRRFPSERRPYCIVCISTCWLLRAAPQK